MGVLSPDQGQAWVMGLAVIGLIIWTVYAFKYRERWLVAVAPLMYFAHILLFNIVEELGLLTIVQTNNWSHAVRLHSEFLFIMLAIILLDRRTNKWI